MARLGHRQPNTVSKVRRPIVVGPIAMYAPIKVQLAAELTRRQLPPQVRTTSTLRPPPKILAPVAVFAPIKTTLAAELTRRQFQPQQRIKSILRKPTVTQAAVVPDGLTATSDISATVLALRGVTPSAFTATSDITGSFSVGGDPTPLQATILTTFATRRHSAHSRLLPPNKIDAAIVTQPAVVTTLDVNLTAVRTRQDWRRRKVLSALRAPTVVDPANVAAPPVDQTRIRVKIAKQPRRQPARVAWIFPAVINPIVMSREQTTVRTTLVAVDVRRDYKRRLVKGFIKTGGQISVVPAALTATSTVTGAVTATTPVVPNAFTATSSMAGSVAKQFLVLPDAFTATSNFGAIISGSSTSAVLFVSSPFLLMRRLMRRHH